MKSLCITGSAQSTLNSFAETLLKAGAKAAAPALRNEKLSITQWHQKVLATQISTPLAKLRPSRAWDQLAIDIFYANDHQPLWLWADESSVQVLDYWLEFDPGIHFVLMHTSPHLALVAALEEGNSTLLALTTVLQAWCTRTQALLNFHLRNPTRSVLIESLQANSEPSNQIQALAKYWKLPLQPVKISTTPKAMDQHLEMYLVHNLLQRHSYAVELHNEVLTRMLATPTKTNSEKQPILDQVLSDLFQKRGELQKVRSTNQELEQRLQANIAALQQTEHNKHIALKDLQEAQSKLEQEKLAMQHQIKELTLEQRKNYDTAEYIRNEILTENEMLLQQLHHTQEELEQKLHLSEQQKHTLDKAQNRIKKLFTQFPDYWDLEEIQLNKIASSNQDIVQWHLRNVYLDDHLIPAIDFETRRENGVLGIFIQRSSKNIKEEWLQWPSGFEDAVVLPCIPCPGAASIGNNAVLSSLSTRDWKRLQLLIKNLVIFLNSPAAKISEAIDRHNLCSGLKELQTALENWPLVFRFDSAELVDSHQEKSYQAMEIRLSNLSLGEDHWQHLEYRLATVDNETGTFGQNPRLEFHEQSRKSLQNWFVESNDRRGARLELRFAYPDALDVKVWNALSKTDRLLIAGLVGSIPRQLASLKLNDSTQLQPWQNWNALGGTLKKILAMNTKPNQMLNRGTSRHLA